MVPWTVRSRIGDAVLPPIACNRLMLRSPAPRVGARSADAGILDEILELNLRRILRLALILVPIHLAHVVLFWRHLSPDDSASESWRQGIITAHSLMLPVALVLAALCTAGNRGALPRHLRALIPAATTVIYLVFGVALAVIDQLVTSSITPVLVATVGVAGTVLMPPLTAAIGYAALLIAFWFLIAWTQMNPDILLSLRVNSITMSGAGFGIAYLMWHNQVLTLKQRREIEAQKRALEEKNRELALLANRDPLTGVSNRSHFTTMAAAEIARLRRHGSSASLILLDIDLFKQINDSYGHPAGDAVLRQVAHVLATAVRDVDTLARLGGEEFAVLLPDTPTEEAAAVAERLRVTIEAHPFVVNGTTLSLTASFGVAPLTPAGPDPIATAYRAADRVLYQAKERGRNQVRVTDPSAVAE